MDMFDNIPEEIDARYLSGAAAFVRSGGEIVDGLGKRDLMFVLNENAGVARVADSDDGRRNQSVVSLEEAGDDALGAGDYTTTVFEEELLAWSRAALE